jgi:hypothetical protein
MSVIPSPWLGHTWTLEHSDSVLENEIFTTLQIPQADEFTLAQNSDGSYTMLPAAPGSLAACWAGCRFTTGGDQPFAFPAGTLPVYSEGSPDCVTKYVDAAELVTQEAHDGTSRLEGTITLSDGVNIVQLYELPQAIDDGSSALVVWIYPQEGTTSNPDGTAVGHN